MIDLYSLPFTNANHEPVTYDGSPITWRVSAYGLVVKNNSILLVKNRLENEYDVPGGGIDIGETLESCLAREGIEEAGAALKPTKLIHHAFGYLYRRSDKRFFQTLQMFYLAEVQAELDKASDLDMIWAEFVPFVDLEKYPLPEEVLKAVKLAHLATQE